MGGIKMFRSCYCCSCRDWRWWGEGGIGAVSFECAGCVFTLNLTDLVTAIAISRSGLSSGMRLWWGRGRG